MDNGVRIPVRVAQPRPYVSRRSRPASEGRWVENPAPPEQQSPDPAAVEGQQVDTGAVQAYDSRAVGEEAEKWRERAVRQQADMENYRRRQQRLAQDRIAEERQRLLGGFLPVVDDLARALEASGMGGAEDQGDEDLRQGLLLIHRSATQMLEKEGVQAVPALGQPFDPNWHDAIATVDSGGTDIVANTVVRVVEPGYRAGDKLLRPAKVVVAVLTGPESVSWPATETDSLEFVNGV
ncbi:nucleotide exchange factor GrpE [Chloroflexota bacterium]